MLKPSIKPSRLSIFLNKYAEIWIQVPTFVVGRGRANRGRLRFIKTGGGAIVRCNEFFHG